MSLDVTGALLDAAPSSGAKFLAYETNAKLLIRKFSFLSIIQLKIMAEGADSRKKSPQELALEEQAAMAKLKSEIAQAEADAAKAKKELDSFGKPATQRETAETEKLVAQARKEAFAAQKELFKGPDITAHTGKLTATGTFIESKILAQKTLQSAIQSLVTAMQGDALFKERELTLLIYHAEDFVQLQVYRDLVDGMIALQKAYIWNISASEVILGLGKGRESFMTVTLLAGYAASGLLRTAADLVSLFKTTTTVTNSDIAVEETALYAALGSALPKKQGMLWKLYIPSLYPLFTVKTKTGPSAFLDQLNNLYALYKKAVDLIEKLDQEKSRLQNAAAMANDNDQKAMYASKIDRFTQAQTALATFNETFLKLQSHLNTSESATGLTVSAGLKRAEIAMELLNQPDVYIIKMVAVSTGSSKTYENLWRNGWVEFSGGTQLSCLIFGPTGEVVFTFQTTTYLPLQKADQIKKNES